MTEIHSFSIPYFGLFGNRMSRNMRGSRRSPKLSTRRSTRTLFKRLKLDENSNSSHALHSRAWRCFPVVHLRRYHHSQHDIRLRFWPSRLPPANK
ncbi:hypothetical protein PM082_015456 [Marasmius tenuissimus]|nr:hypothetical protein PM082_015456 [Marasmius tenuissimus]